MTNNVSTNSIKCICAMISLHKKDATLQGNALFALGKIFAVRLKFVNSTPLSLSSKPYAYALSLQL